MTPRKLSESDKQQILELYRQPGETTSTLASRYGVSNSTISRILKNSFSEEEYEALIQQKRGARSVTDVAETDEVLEDPVVYPVVPVSVSSEQLEMPLSPEKPPAPGRRLRKRSSVGEVEVLEPPLLLDEPAPSGVLEPDNSGLLPVATFVDEGSLEGSASPGYLPEAIEIEEILNEDLLEEEDDLDELEDDLEELEDDDLDELDVELEQGALLATDIGGKLFVDVLPLAQAPIPRTCYLVVDRAAELIARPLRDFGDLGQIPEAETQEKTLPVFDNHRVAKRFSNPRTQRVIKLPDGNVLQKASYHLQAKGITRLLIDGHVYSL